VLALNDTELENTVCDVDIDDMLDGHEVCEVVDVGEDIKEEEEKDVEEFGDRKAL